MPSHTELARLCVDTFHNGNFTIADMRHKKVRCDKLIYLGVAITELTKLHMDCFFYDQ